MNKLSPWRKSANSIKKQLHKRDGQGLILALYKKFLAFYPQAFREQFGESMVQTFNDLSREREEAADQGYFRFVCWVFIETVIGIIKERVRQISEEDTVKNIFANLRLPLLTGLAFMLPFMALELVNRRNFNEAFPLPLFGMLWLLPVIFTSILTPVLQNVRVGNTLIVNPAALLFRIVFLTFIALVWVAVLVDQMPCFLGVPKCD
jgi:hypothetical protein